MNDLKLALRQLLKNPGLQRMDEGLEVRGEGKDATRFYD
jgi:hypothetical protein